MTADIHDGEAHALLAWVRQIADRDDCGVIWQDGSGRYSGWVGRRVLSPQPTRQLAEIRWPYEIRRIVG